MCNGSQALKMKSGVRYFIIESNVCVQKFADYGYEYEYESGKNN